MVFDIKQKSTKKMIIDKSVDKRSKNEQKVTKMVLLMCIFYLVGNVPNSISPILFTIKVDPIFYQDYVIFGNFMLFISRGSYFFIYYYFNQKFYHVYIKLISKFKFWKKALKETSQTIQSDGLSLDQAN